MARLFLIFKDFDWDEANIEHILRHNVVPFEVEEACFNKPYVRKTLEDRYLIYGTTDSGRYLFIVGIKKERGIFQGNNGKRDDREGKISLQKEKKMKKIPKFKSEKEEAEFWASHDSTDFLDETKEVKVKFVRPKKKLVSLRLDEKTIKELKKLAQKKGIGYLELVRMWVLENLGKTKAA